MMNSKTEPTSPQANTINLRRSTRNKSRVSYGELDDPTSLQVKTEAINNSNVMAGQSDFSKLPIASIYTISKALSTKHEIINPVAFASKENKENEPIILENQEIKFKSEVGDDDLLIIDLIPGKIESEKEV